MSGVPEVEQSGTADTPRSWPGQPDMWVFVVFEAFLFTAYFTVYMIARTGNIELFLQSQQQLDLRIGAFNTLVLLASSWSMARCVAASRDGSYRDALAGACLTVFLGLTFLISKVLEWSSEIGRGFTFTSDEFATFYFFLTGLHFLHLLIGLVVLGIVIRELRSPPRRSQELVETGATYWHTVDFIWVMIFSLVYVLR